MTRPISFRPRAYLNRGSTYSAVVCECWSAAVLRRWRRSGYASMDLALAAAKRAAERFRKAHQKRLRVKRAVVQQLAQDIADIRGVKLNKDS